MTDRLQIHISGNVGQWIADVFELTHRPFEDGDS